MATESLSEVVPGVQRVPTLFEHPAFGSIRIIEQGSEPWFVARDVAVALGYADPANAIQRHCKKVNDSNMGVSSQVPSPKIIPESDVYRLVMRSNLPHAERFQDWVVEEVLPSIRRTGGYMHAMPDDTPEAIMARAVLVAQDTIKRLQDETAALQAQVTQDRPKVVFADSIAISETCILVRELAKLIKQSTGYDIGERRLFAWLRQRGYLHKTGSDHNMPTQKSMDMSLFVIQEGARIGSSGKSHITKTPKVTGKGQIYFVNKFKEIYESGHLSALPAASTLQEVEA